ncbi:30S ribosomal protein S4e [Candidatus Woesearchaeota archaeon]|nr:30S ribosomal protein S4e [Candidatus Woesearchaeota archaeon]
MGNIGEKHLSRLAMPKTWKIKKKGIKWVTKPLAGSHSTELGMPLNLILKDILGYAKTNKEAKNILNHQEILVDGKRRKDPRFIVGLMDVLSIPKIKNSFRMLLDQNGYLYLKKLDEKEAPIKPSKIVGKKPIKKKIQLNLFDGKNILIDKDNYKVGDSVLIELPSQKIIDRLKLEKNCSIYLTAGKYVGSVGILQEIQQDKIIYKTEGKEHITLKKYAFVVGKEKPVIDLEAKK